MHNNAHVNFVPDLDMNPSPAWSKPASALNLSNPLHHLPQSQQVRRLQQQIQQHRQLQHQQSQGGYGLGAHLSKKKKNNTSSDLPQQQHRHERQEYQAQHPFGGGGGGGGGHQHISIKSDDMNSDDDADDDDDEESSSEFGDRGSKGSKSNRDQQDGNCNNGETRMPGLHHHRSLSHPQLTQGFTIPVSSGFAGFGGHGPTSPLSPGSPGSATSETSSITASMLSPGLMTSSNQSYYGHHGHNNNGNNGLQGIESSLASLASLSVLSAAAGGSPTSIMPISMPMSSRGSRHHGMSGSNNMATTPTTSSFQPQSLPMMYHTGHNNANGFMPTTTTMTSAGPHGPSFNAFSTALSQHFQRQQQQQQEQMTSAALSSSLPVQSFSQFQQQQQQHQLQQQQQQQQSIQQDQSPPQKQHQRSRSKSLTIPAPRIIPPTRVIPPRPPQTSAPRKYHGRQTRKLPSASPIASKEDVDPTRRVAHIISEQKRREKINGGFDELKSVIPECAQNTDSKATILRKAVDYILMLEDELRKYTDVYQMEAGGEDPESSLEGHERER